MTYSPDEKMKHDYLQNKLSPEDKLQFETWLFDHPNEQEELELDLILKAGVNNFYQEDSVEKVNGIKWLPAFGVAAAFVLMTVGLLSTQNSSTLNDGLLVPQVSVFSQVRSAEQMTWKLDSNVDQLIQVPVSYLSDDAYQINITGEADLELKDLHPYLDTVSFIVSKNTLKAGNYQLELTNQNTQEKQHFDFQVNDKS